MIKNLLTFLLCVSLIPIFGQYTVDFGAADVCEGATTNLVAFVAPQDSAVMWEWDIDDDGVYGDLSGPNVTHVFDSAATWPVGLQVTFNDGTILTHSEDINVRKTPNPSILTDSGCEQSPTLLTAAINNNVTIDTYRWDVNGDNIFGDVENNNAEYTYPSYGVYNLKVKVRTIYGCEAIATNQVDVAPVPSGSFEVTKNCFGDSSLFTSTSTVALGSVDQYLWDINMDGNYDDGFGDNISFQYANTGFKSASLLCITDKGCQAEVTEYFSIYPKPDANFTLRDACVGVDIRLQNITNYDIGTTTYFWDFADGDTSVLYEPIKTYDTPGVYDINLLAISDQGCTDTTSNLVEIFDNPTAVYSIEDACRYSDLEISNNSYTNTGFIVAYKWDFGNGIIDFSQFPDYAYDVAGDYQVEMVVTNNFNCTDTLYQDLTIHAGPSISIGNNSGFEFCSDDSVKLVVYPPAESTTIWSNGTTSEINYVHTGGMHYVTVFDSLGCMDKDSMELTLYQVPLVEAGPDFSIQLGEYVTLEGQGEGFPTWEGQNIVEPNLWRSTLQPDDSGYYMLTASNLNGCTAYDSVYVDVEKSYVLDPTSLVSPNGDGKNDGWIIRNIEKYPECEVTIYNRWNQVMYQTTGYMNEWEGTYGNELLPEGAYYYTITCPGTDIRYAGSINLIR